MSDAPSPVLLVTPDTDIRMTCRSWLREEGLAVLEASTAAEALAYHRRSTIPLTISEALLPGLNGIELLGRIRELNAEAEVALLADSLSLEFTVAAMKAGAIDFLAKPIERHQLVNIARSTMRRPGSGNLSTRRRQLMANFDFSGIVAHSEPMIRILELVTRVAPMDCTVLITGPSGSGKEVIARALHRNSARAKKPFVSINCSAIPDTLLESELFGYRRAAFAGALADKTGLLESAAGGTVLLDGIDEIAPSVQAKLLHFLQSHSYSPVGSVHMRHTDVRVLAATKASLEDRVQGGSFREDLYYRLCAFLLYLAPLTQRRDDIIPLAQHALAQLRNQLGKPVPGLSREALRYLATRPWHGNVRELQNAIERAVILSDGKLLTSADFRSLETTVGRSTNGGTSDLWTLPPDGIDLDALVRSLTVQSLDRTGLKVSPAARLLGISRATLRYRIKKYSLDLQPYPD